MPRNVRNFWVELEVDGRRERVATGPQGKDGGFELTIKQRFKGEIVNVLTVKGVALQQVKKAGTLALLIEPGGWGQEFDAGAEVTREGELVVGPRSLALRIEARR
ncbi:MAG: hypothetical protein V3R71_06115, partial [Gemmatimonadales bacterium]